MDAAAELERAEAGVPDRPPRQPEAPRFAAGWTGARGAPTRFLLLRHGQTELSVERRYSGRGNPALTDLGRRQADAAAAVSRAAGRYRGRGHARRCSAPTTPRRRRPRRWASTSPSTTT